MLSCSRLKELCARNNVSIDELAGHLARGGFDRQSAITALRNWQQGLVKPQPSRDDVERLAGAIGVGMNELSEWKASLRYAPIAPRKARLVTELIAGRNVQDALDLLKFTHRRASDMVRKVLQSAIANADEQQADVEKLYVSQARVDGAGRRIGTKGFRAKDRGRAHSIRKEASHIHIKVAEE